MLEIIGQSTGQYQILERVGQGGMSVIYKALDQKQDRTVAIKVLSAARASDPAFEARFAREIEVLRTLKHRRILPILDYGDIGGLPFIVMPFYPHGTLRDRMENGISIADGARIINHISEALEYAHTKGITHRDVKPTNILLTKRNQAVLSDFGFAHYSDSSLSLTGSALIGTPAYMSPEQIRGKEITGASDQYSLAIVMYELVTGRTPFEADSPLVLVFNHLNDPVPDPREFNPHIPDETADALLKALNKKPKRRFPSVAELNKAFQASADGQSLAKTPQLSTRKRLRTSLLGVKRRMNLFISALFRNPEGRRRARNAALLSLFIFIPVLALASATFGVWGGSANSPPANQSEDSDDLTAGSADMSGSPSATPTTAGGMTIPRTGGDGDGEDGPRFTSSPTTTSTSTPHPTSTLQIWFYPSPTIKPPTTATPTPTEIPSMHVSDIDVTKHRGSPSVWETEVKVCVESIEGTPIEGAIVTGSWSPEGYDVDHSCTTKGNGDCRIKNKYIFGAESTTFTVTGVSYPGYIYTPSDNTDPDGDSDGTSIVIMAPDD